MKKYLRKSDLLLLDKSSILSTIEYNSPLLIEKRSLNRKNAEKLEKVQRRCHRIICDIECHCDQFTPLSERRQQQALKMFLAMRDPEHLSHHLIPHSLSRSCRSHIFILPFFRTSLRLRSFIPMCLTLTNSLHIK